MTVFFLCLVKQASILVLSIKKKKIFREKKNHKNFKRYACRNSEEKTKMRHRSGRKNAQTDTPPKGVRRFHANKF